MRTTHQTSHVQRRSHRLRRTERSRAVTEFFTETARTAAADHRFVEIIFTASSRQHEDSQIDSSHTRIFIFISVHQPRWYTVSHSKRTYVDARSPTQRTCRPSATLRCHFIVLFPWTNVVCRVCSASGRSQRCCCRASPTFLKDDEWRHTIDSFARVSYELVESTTNKGICSEAVLVPAIQAAS